MNREQAARWGLRKLTKSAEREIDSGKTNLESIAKTCWRDVEQMAPSIVAATRDELAREGAEMTFRVAEFLDRDLMRRFRVAVMEGATRAEIRSLLDEIMATVGRLDQEEFDRIIDYLDDHEAGA